MEGFPSPQNTNESQENLPVTKEQVLYAFWADVENREKAMELLNKWIDETRVSIETIADATERNRATLSFELDKAEVYIDSGFAEVALEELEGDGNQESIEYLAWHRGETELHARAMALIEKIKGPEIKEASPIDHGVDFIYEQHPELERIGSKQEYQQYLESIYPESVLKQVVYHYSNYDHMKEDGFKFSSETGIVAGAGGIEAIYFTGSEENYWGSNDLNKYAAILNVRHPLDGREAVDVDDPKIKEYDAIYKEGSDRDFGPLDKENPYQLQQNRAKAFTDRGYDAVLAPGLGEIAIFDTENIHILGSRSDIEKFQDFTQPLEK
jgi:hypothetical protein